MANIDKELNQIKHAVYGREVRGSIHDGIKKINNELERGRGIVDRSITPHKTTFFESTKNLYHGDLVRGFVYDRDDPRSGRFGEGSNAMSCIIKIEPNETYTITPYGGNRKIYAVYENYPEYGDESVKLVNGTNHNHDPVTFTNPSNGNYLVVYLSSSGADVKCQVEKGDTNTNYEPPYKLPANNIGILEESNLPKIPGENIKNKTIKEDKLGFLNTSTKNLFHGILVPGFVYGTENGGGIVDGQFGEPSPSSNAMSCIIKIEPNETYTVTSYGGNRRRYAVYESYPEYGDEPVELIMSFVSGGTGIGSERTFVNPSNGHYLALYLSTQGEDVKCQVEKGEEATEYEPHYLLKPSIGLGFSKDDRDEGSIQSEKIRDKYHVYSSFQLDYMPIEQEPANEDGTFNGNVSTHTDIYDLFDNLMNRYPDYITKQEIGRDNYNLPIYTYKFDPPHPRHHETYPVERLKLLLFSGVHGDERTWPYTLFKIFEEICERNDNETLAYLRWNTTIFVTPVAVPSGYDDDTRNNRDGININRNFEFNWDENGEGSTPFSEPEAAAIKGLIDDNLDAEILLDFHNYFSPRNHLLWAPIAPVNLREGFTKFINSYFSMLTGKWTQRYDWMPMDEELSRISDSAVPSLSSYGKQKGMVSHTVEIRDHIPQKPNNKKLDETNIEFAMEYAVNMIGGIINTL